MISSESPTFRVWLLLSLLVFLASQAYGFWSLELDGAPFSIRGVAFGDCMGWATSARVKYLFGVFARPYLDLEWYVAAPLHTVGLWLGFELCGYTLTGLRFFSYFFMLLAKLALCWLVWREMGRRWLPWALIFASLHLPLLTLSRMANPVVVQIAFFVFAVAGLYLAETKRSRTLHFIAGLLLGLTFWHKPHNFFMPLFPALFFWLQHQLVLSGERPFRETLKDAAALYGGFAAFCLAWVALWLLPHAAEFLNFTLLGWGYSPPLSAMDMALHLGDVLMSMLPDSREYLVPHANWLFAALMLSAAVMMLDRTSIKTVDLVVVAYTVIIMIQQAYFYVSWGRVMTLIPLGSYAMLRLLHLIACHRDAGWLDQPGVLRRAALGAFAYVAAVTALNLLASSLGKWNFLLAAVLAVAAAWRLPALVRHQSRAVAVSVAAIMVAASLGALQPIYGHFTDRRTVIRDTARELAALGPVKTLGLYHYALYNSIDEDYVGTYATSSKPTDFVWAASQGLSMPELARKYRFRSPWALALWLAGEFQPRLYDFWRLPSDYRKKYQSHIFMCPPASAVLPSSRYLLVGAGRPQLYIRGEWTEQFLRYGSAVPSTEKAMTVTTIDEKNLSTQTADVLKVTGWRPNIVCSAPASAVD